MKIVDGRSCLEEIRGLILEYAEMLGEDLTFQNFSEKLEHLLEVCRLKADYVIIDSSPMGVTSDVEVLMKYADSVLLVVRQDWSDIRAVNDKADIVRQSRKDFSGFLLNAFHREPDLMDGTPGGYGYYGYRRYHKGR